MWEVRTHPCYDPTNELSRAAIGAAIEVRCLKGPGPTESIHEQCLTRELGLCQIAAVRQHLVRVGCKGLVLGEPLRLADLSQGCGWLGLQCAQQILPIPEAQRSNQPKLLAVPLRLLGILQELLVADGPVRLIGPGVKR